MTRQHPRAYIRALSLEETRRRVEHATTPAAARVEELPRKVLPATLHGVLVAISAHQFDAAGVCWASHYTLALEAQCSVRTVQRALRWAELLGLVVVVEAPHGGRAKGETHGYRVVRVEGAPTSKDWSKWDRGRREKWLARKLKGGPEELAARAKARAEVMRERVERERERARVEARRMEQRAAVRRGLANLDRVLGAAEGADDGAGSGSGAAGGVGPSVRRDDGARGGRPGGGVPAHAGDGSSPLPARMEGATRTTSAAASPPAAAVVAVGAAGPATSAAERPRPVAVLPFSPGVHATEHRTGGHPKPSPPRGLRAAAFGAPHREELAPPAGGSESDLLRGRPARDAERLAARLASPAAARDPAGALLGAGARRVPAAVSPAVYSPPLPRAMAEEIAAMPPALRAMAERAARATLERAAAVDATPEGRRWRAEMEATLAHANASTGANSGRGPGGRR